jgi:hypothetical protein
MVKLRNMTKARQISAIQRHAQIYDSLRSVALSAAFESGGQRGARMLSRRGLDGRLNSGNAVFWRSNLLELIYCSPRLRMYSLELQSNGWFTPALPHFWVGTFQNNLLGVLYKKSQTNKVSKWEPATACIFKDASTLLSMCDRIRLAAHPSGIWPDPDASVFQENTYHHLE